MRPRMLGSLLLVVPLLLVALPSAQAQQGEVGGEGLHLEPVGNVTDWRRLLAATRESSVATGYRASMTIVQLDVEGPWVTEVPIAHEEGGRMEIGRPERWLVGRDGATSAFFVDGVAGTGLRMATDAGQSFDVEHLEELYLVEIVGRATLSTGTALAVTFTRRDAATPSERVFVDDATSLVVRRETYDVDGSPVRVVSLRDLVVTGEVRMTSDRVMEGVADAGPRMSLSRDGIALLDDAGWVAPQEIALGFELMSASVMSDAAGDAVRLEYSDGLYQVSVYEQAGTLAPDAMRGAVPLVRGDHHVHRWPGSEPERLVWSGGGRTFTAVSDAPTERLMQVIAPLPADLPGGVVSRVKRGLSRIGGWLWPFDGEDA